jgi:hypothetical protein
MRRSASEGIRVFSVSSPIAAGVCRALGFHEGRGRGKREEESPPGWRRERWCRSGYRTGLTVVMAQQVPPASIMAYNERVTISLFLALYTFC